ncbi:MAG: hypothetical protein ACOYL3_25570 [Desulfuromonadaceae bacterium]
MLISFSERSSILLVSDGITKVYSTTENANLVQDIFDKTGDIGMAIHELVTRLRSKKSVDDITVMVIETTDED